MLVFNKRKTVLVCQHEALPWETHNAMLDHIVHCEADYVPASVSSYIQDARHAKVMFRMDGPLQIIHDLVRAMMPDIWPIFELEGAGTRPETIELQVTAHGNGDYFRAHNDNGSPDSSNRVVTFVYYLSHHYLNTGALRLYETRDDGSMGPPELDLFPQPNSLLFFTSSTWHEVLPVNLPTDRFADSRFTVNGWFRR